MIMFEKLLTEYADKFDENFPLFQVRHLDEDEIIKLIEAALENDEPYEVEEQENVDY